MFTLLLLVSSQWVKVKWVSYRSRKASRYMMHCNSKNQHCSVRRVKRGKTYQKRDDVKIYLCDELPFRGMRWTRNELWGFIVVVCCQMRRRLGAIVMIRHDVLCIWSAGRRAA